MAFVLINTDNTINFIGDELYDWLCLDDVDVVEIEEKDSESVLGGVTPINAVWFWKDNRVVSSKDHPELVGAGTQNEYKEKTMNGQNN